DKKRIGGGAHADQRGEVEFDQFDAAAIGGLIPYDFRCAPRLVEIAGRADHLCAMRGEGAGGFHTEASRNAGDKDALAGQVDALQYFVGGGVGVKCLAHNSLLCSMKLFVEIRSALVALR